MAASSPCFSAPSFSSSQLPEIITCNPSQCIQVRWDRMKTLHVPLTRHGKRLLKEHSASCNRNVLVQAEYNGRRGGGAGDFVAGFLFGGVVFGALGYLFAPQVSNFILGVDRRRVEQSKKLSKVFDDDEGLEKTRRNLNEKIAQLNAAIDDVSAQLRSDDGFGVPSESTPELESAI